MHGKTEASIYDTFDQESPIATEMRRLYSNIRHTQGKGEKRSFLVTSANRGEGKSTVASHLALTVARFRNKKSLIVDADLRRPRLHQIFNVPKNPGLLECLEGKADLSCLEKYAGILVPGDLGNGASRARSTRSAMPGRTRSLIWGFVWACS